MKVLYFAWLRERLNRGEEQVDPPASVTTVAELIAWLRSRDEVAELALQRPEIIRAALDGKLASAATPIAGASVVALFPPMTGG